VEPTSEAGSHAAGSPAPGTAGSGGVIAADGGSNASGNQAGAGTGGAAHGGTGGFVAAGGAGATAGSNAGASGGAGGATAGRSAPQPDAEATYLSETDHTPNDIALSPDRLGAEWLTGSTAGVRSTRAVAPGSGVFYFEAVAALDYFDIGVAPVSARLNSPAGSADNGGFSVNVIGYYASAGNTTEFKPAANATYGLIVDYRGTHPVVYLIAGSSGPGELVTTQTLSGVSQPLFIQLSGERRAAGFQVRINAGNDRVNFPFTLDPTAALNAAGAADVASQLTPGWGKTPQLPLNAAPVLKLESAKTASLALGASVTLRATATDAEDGDLTGRIRWDVLSEGNGPERVHGSGGSFTFEPNAIGQHPIVVSIRDAGNKEQTDTITVTTTGSLQQFDRVRLTVEPGLTGEGIELDADGLRARWTIDQKMGVRANQGLYGDFQYVEGRRLVPAWNQAIGLVIGHVTLNPYAFNVTPPSCSVNGATPFVSVWQNLISVADTGLDAASVEYYGLAVDYRSTSPIVYVITGGRLLETLRLTDVTVPIYPMLYGNVTPSDAAYDMEINFGAKPFHEDPVAVLSAAGVSTTGLKLCWGNCAP